MADTPLHLQRDPYGEKIEAMRFDWRDARVLEWIDHFWKFGQMDSKRNLRRQRVHIGALLRSVKWRTWNDSGGDRQVFEARYNYYAKFVELALGKGMPFKELPPAIQMRKWPAITMPDGRPRKAKPSIPTEMRKQARKFTTMIEDRYSFHGMALMVYALGPSVKNQALIRSLLYNARFSQTMNNSR